MPNDNFIQTSNLNVSVVARAQEDLEKAAKAELYLHINPSLNKVNNE